VARIQESIIRVQRYQALRGVGASAELLADTRRLIAGGILETAEVMEGSTAAGRTLRELALRDRTGAMVLSVVRRETPLPTPDGSTRLEAGDLIVLFGPHEAIDRAFALLEPGPGFKIESLKPEGQKIEKDFRDAVQKRTGSYPLGGHQLAGGGLWLLKLVLDRAKSDDADKFRDAVMSLDLPAGSMINGWGVKFNQEGQNANERVQHYMLQWQNGQLVTVWPEEFTTMRAKWIPLPAWDERK